MRELTYKQSVEAAKPIKIIAEAARELDVEYLKECLQEMKKNHSLRESAMVLNPNPHTAIEVSDLELCKIKGLDLMIQLAENQKVILSAEIKLSIAKRNSSSLESLFGI